MSGPGQNGQNSLRKYVVSGYGRMSDLTPVNGMRRAPKGTPEAAEPAIPPATGQPPRRPGRVAGPGSGAEAGPPTRYAAACGSEWYKGGATANRFDALCDLGGTQVRVFDDRVYVLFFGTIQTTLGLNSTNATTRLAL